MRYEVLNQIVAKGGNRKLAVISFGKNIVTNYLGSKEGRGKK